MSSIRPKVNYVLRQGDNASGQHHCHWPGCKRSVPPAMWGCKKHWYQLPQNLRQLIWESYRPGQEISKRPSAEYLDAADQVQRWISEYEARKPQQGVLL